MSYIDEIFKRANIQQICSFLIAGSATTAVDKREYEQRLSRASEICTDIMKNHSKYDFKKMENEIVGALGIYEDVYFEIGLKIGLILSGELENEKRLSRCPNAKDILR